MSVDPAAQASKKAALLIRDGTIFGAGRTEIDLRTPDYAVWVTVKGDSDERVEAVANQLAVLSARLAAAETENERLREALSEAYPYVNGAVFSDQPWRAATAIGVRSRIDAALASPVTQGDSERSTDGGN